MLPRSIDGLVAWIRPDSGSYFSDFSIFQKYAMVCQGAARDGVDGCVLDEDRLPLWRTWNLIGCDCR